MSEWNLVAEDLLAKHSSGEITKYHKSLDSLLISKEPSVVACDWSTLLNVRKEFAVYLRAGCFVDEHLRSEEFASALLSVADGVEKIESKMKYFSQSLERDVLGCVQDCETASLEELLSYRSTLDSVAQLAEVTSHTLIATTAKKHNETISALVSLRIDKKSWEQSEKAQLESKLLSAQKALDQGNPKELQQQYNSLQLVQKNNPSPDVQDLLSRYEIVLDEVYKQRNDHLWSLAKKTSIVFAAVSLLYLGASAVHSLGARMSHKIDARTESVSSELASLETISAGVHPVTDGGEYSQLHAMSLAPQKMIAPELASPRTASVSEFFSRLYPLIAESTYSLVVEKKSNVSYLLDSQGIIISEFSHTDAQNPLPKNSQGQLRTPEGVYSIDNSYLLPNARTLSYTGNHPELGNPTYGLGFLRLNYPTAQEQKIGYTGGGVLLCSASSQEHLDAIRSKRDIMNVGIAYDPQDFLSIYDAFEKSSGSFTVIIEDEHARPLGGSL